MVIVRYGYSFKPHIYNTLSFLFADSEVPLAEDWDLQGFEPLQKVLNKFKLVSPK